jgi:Leucine-rich repeat (LRR) protein
MSTDIHIRSIKEFNQLSTADLAQVKSIRFNLYKEKTLDIPNSIYACSNLNSLHIDRNETCFIAPEIAQLKRLQVLEIIQCPIHDLPKELGELQELTVLKCEQTLLKKIPKSVFECTNLTELSFTRSLIKSIPKEIKQLQKLQKLEAHHSTLEELPKELTELPNLTELKLYAVPIKTLPEWIGQLKSIKLLGLPKTHYSQVPYFLFQLKKLVYYCIPSFTVDGVPEAITKQLEEYLKRHCSVAGAQAYVQLMLSPNTENSKIPLKHFVEVTNIDNKIVVQKVLDYLKKQVPNTLNSHPFQEGSEVAILGKFDGLGLDYIKELFSNKGISITTKVSKTSTHVVLCYENKRKFDPNKFPNLVLLSNEELVQWAKINEGAGYLESTADNGDTSMQESIEELLLSSSAENIELALEMLKSGGVSQSMICPLLIAYSDLTNYTEEGKITRNNIRQTLYNTSVLSESIKKQIRRDLSKGGFSFSPSHRPEREYKKRLERKGKKEFDMTRMAKHYFKTQKHAYLYLLESDQVSEADKYAFVQNNFIQDKTMDLSELKQLNKFPPILAQFDFIENINLEHCAFAVFPSIIRDGAFPKLKQINLRNNPIQTLSKSVLKKLPRCFIELDISYSSKK